METFYAVGLLESRQGAKVDASRELVASAVPQRGRVCEATQGQALFQQEEPAADVWLIARELSSRVRASNVQLHAEEE